MARNGKVQEAWLFLPLFFCMLFFLSASPADAPETGLMISEAVSGNYASYYVSGDRGADLIEIVNRGPETVNLGEYCLSDSRGDPYRYALPDRKLKPGEYYVVQCDDNGGKNRAPFKISSDGETLYLYKKDGTLADRLKMPALPLDRAYGRNDTGEDRYFSAFTPGQANGEGCLRIAKTPEIGVSSRGFTDPFEVTIQGEEPIYYTLDGSVPAEAGERYTGPVRITETCCLRAVSMPEGAVPSRTASATYRADCGAYSLPTLTVSLPKTYLKGSANALLNHTEDRSLAVPAVAVMLDPEGKELFTRECGLGISGQTSRGRTYRGWKLKFKEMYGGSLRKAVFPEAGQTIFDSLNLRVGSSFNPTHDVLGTLIGAETMPAVLCQYERPVYLFIRDTAYGVYYLRDNINRHFVAQRLGGSEKQVDIIYRAYTVEEGSGADWRALLEYCRTHDLSESEPYAYVLSQVNPESFIDYYIWRAYTGDTDFPNFRVARCRDAKDVRWHLIMYDLDWAFQEKNKEKIGLKTYAYTAYDSAKRNNLVLTSLLKNPAFRELFLERLAIHMRVTFRPERINGLLDQILSEVMPDMPSTWEIRKTKVAKWKDDAEEIRRFIGSGKTDRRLQLLKETKAFFQLSDEEMRDRFGDLWNPQR